MIFLANFERGGNDRATLFLSLSLHTMRRNYLFRHRRVGEPGPRTRSEKRNYFS